MLLNGDWTDLNKRMFVMMIFPMSFVTMPIALLVVMPIFIIPVVVSPVFVSPGRQRCRDDRSQCKERENDLFIELQTSAQDRLFKSSRVGMPDLSRDSDPESFCEFFG